MYNLLSSLDCRRPFWLARVIILAFVLRPSVKIALTRCRLYLNDGFRAQWSNT